MLHVELQNFFFRHGIDLLHSESSPYYCGTCLPSPSANLLHLGLSADHLSGRFTTVMHKTCLCIFTCLVKDSQNAGYPIHKISPCQHLDKCTKYVCVNICYKKKWHMKLDENSPACYLRAKTEVPCFSRKPKCFSGTEMLASLSFTMPTMCDHMRQPLVLVGRLENGGFK